jgi:hypothetical protein
MKNLKIIGRVGLETKGVNGYYLEIPANPTNLCLVPLCYL